MAASGDEPSAKRALEIRRDDGIAIRISANALPFAANPLGPPGDPERFPTFDDCVETLMESGMSEERARRICGAWENNLDAAYEWEAARKFVGNRPGRAIDPTQTITLRKRYMAEMRRRFRDLRGVVRYAVVENDVLGLREDSQSPTRLPGSSPNQNAEAPSANQPYQGPLEPPPPGAFNFPRDGDKVEGFMSWLEEQERRGILGTADIPLDRRAAEASWQTTYIRNAYSKGAEHAKFAAREAGIEVADQDLDLLFRSPRHAEALGLAYTRAFRELDGVTSAMDQQISRTLAEGLAEGVNPREMARRINDRVSAIGRTRAELIARTETIRAFNQSALNRYRGIGVERVGAVVEFVTAGDERVCPECEFLAGRTFGVDDADGLIPVHPNCRCTWIPVPQGRRPEDGGEAGRGESIRTGDPYFDEHVEDISSAGLPPEMNPLNAERSRSLREAGMTGGMNEEVMRIVDTPSGRLFVKNYAAASPDSGDSLDAVARSRLIGRFGGHAPETRRITGDNLDMLVTRAVEGRPITAVAGEAVDPESFLDTYAATILTGNSDLHGGNLFVDAAGKVISIDNDLGDWAVADQWDFHIAYQFQGHVNTLGLDVDIDDLNNRIRAIARTVDIDSLDSDLRDMGLPRSKRESFIDGVRRLREEPLISDETIEAATK